MLQSCPHCGETVRNMDAPDAEDLYELAPREFTQRELYERANEHDDISLSTVRKRIYVMQDEGWVREVEADSRQKRYTKATVSAPSHKLKSYV